MSDQQDSESHALGRPGTRAQSSELTKTLLNAALSAFAEHGFESARIYDIARRCNLTTGAIYSRWANKQELFLAAVDYAIEGRAVSSVIGSDASIMEKFTALGAEALESVGDDRRSLLLEACVLARRDSSHNPDIAGVLEKETGVFLALIEEAKEQGIISPELDSVAFLLCHQALYLGIELILSLETWRNRKPDLNAWGVVMAAYTSDVFITDE